MQVFEIEGDSIKMKPNYLEVDVFIKRVPSNRSRLIRLTPDDLGLVCLDCLDPDSRYELQIFSGQTQLCNKDYLYKDKEGQIILYCNTSERFYQAWFSIYLIMCIFFLRMINLI